jgi:D-arabinose 1-dehydrogenase-like Zn-dependent alcohol dehydrogenase
LLIKFRESIKLFIILNEVNMAQARNLDNWKDMPLPAAQEDEYQEAAWGKVAPEAKFSPMFISRAKVGDFDVKLEILYCGICHSDLHRGLNDLGGAMYPIVPGHEMVGVVAEVGAKVTKLKVGDNAGIGCLADGCLDCGACKAGDE